MTEIPQQLPIEVQLKKNIKFVHLLGIVPDYSGKVVELTGVKENNPEDVHSSMWLEYLTSLNVIAEMLKIEEGELNHEEMRRVQNKAFAATLVKVSLAIEKTRHRADLEGSMAKISTGLAGLSSDDIDWHYDVIMDLPEVLIRAADGKIQPEEIPVEFQHGDFLIAP